MAMLVFSFKRNMENIQSAFSLLLYPMELLCRCPWFEDLDCRMPGDPLKDSQERPGKVNVWLLSSGVRSVCSLVEALVEAKQACNARNR